MTFCGKSYRVPADHRQWLEAHRKAKHKLVIREVVRKGKSRVVCKI